MQLAEKAKQGYHPEVPEGQTFRGSRTYPTNAFNFSGNSTNPYLLEARHGKPSCIICGINSPILLDGSQYHAFFVLGGRIAECFPDLELWQREMLLTGTHDACWDSMATDDEEYDDDY